MPEFDLTTQGKIAEIRQRRIDGETIETYEMIRIGWPSPDGAVYYSVLPLDDLEAPPAVGPIETRLLAENSPAWFQTVSLDASLGDEEVEFELWDADGVISDLLETHGEGSAVELIYYFPVNGLLLTAWHGHLRVEDEADIERVRLTAAQGFRSSEALVPRRAHYQECQNIFGAVFTSQAELDEHAGCPYNRHLPGGVTGNLNGGVPFTSCPRRTLAQCTARLGNARFHLSHQTVSAIVINNQTSGPRLLSTSRGNETNLKEAVRVVMGQRRIYNMQVVAYRKDLNNNTPDRGLFVGLYEAAEGPVENISLVRFNVKGVLQNAVALHYAHIFGENGQAVLDPNLSGHAYSYTALVRYAFGWVDPRTVEPGDASATAVITGLNDIRIYTDADTYTTGYTTNRVWHIARILCDKRWGFGLDYDRLDIPSFITAAEWAAENVRYTDINGDHWDHVRAESNVELIARKVQQQIEDMCLGGRLSKPFLFNGKVHIVPLSALTEEELAAAPEFTDEGDHRNILWDGIRSTLKRQRQSDSELINRIECTFDDIEQDYLEQPLPPVEDINAQLAAGRIVGDYAKKINPKKYNLLGVVKKAQGMKLAWGLLDLGPFDEGGLMNNLRLKFKIWFIDSLELHPYKIIRVTSSQLTRYGFTYFRIMKMQRNNDLTVDIEAQAYNEDYMDTFETVIDLEEPPSPPWPTEPIPTPPPQIPGPLPIDIDNVTYEDGFLTVTPAAS